MEPILGVIPLRTDPLKERHKIKSLDEIKSEVLNLLGLPDLVSFGEISGLGYLGIVKKIGKGKDNTVSNVTPVAFIRCTDEKLSQAKAHDRQTLVANKHLAERLVASRFFVENRVNSQKVRLLEVSNDEDVKYNVLVAPKTVGPVVIESVQNYVVMDSISFPTNSAATQKLLKKDASLNLIVNNSEICVCTPSLIETIQEIIKSDPKDGLIGYNNAAYNFHGKAGNVFISYDEKRGYVISYLTVIPKSARAPTSDKVQQKQQPAFEDNTFVRLSIRNYTDSTVVQSAGAATRNYVKAAQTWLEEVKGILRIPVTAAP